MSDVKKIKIKLTLQRFDKNDHGEIIKKKIIGINCLLLWDVLTKNKDLKSPEQK